MRTHHYPILDNCPQHNLFLTSSLFPCMDVDLTIKPSNSNWSRDWPAPWASLVFHLDSSSRDLSFKGVMPRPCCRVRPKSASRAKKGWSLRSSYGAFRTLKIGFGPDRRLIPDSGLIRSDKEGAKSLSIHPKLGVNPPSLHHQMIESTQRAFSHAECDPLLIAPR